MDVLLGEILSLGDDSGCYEGCFSEHGEQREDHDDPENFQKYIVDLLDFILMKSQNMLYKIKFVYILRELVQNQFFLKEQGHLLDSSLYIFFSKDLNASS